MQKKKIPKGASLSHPSTCQRKLGPGVTYLHLISLCLLRRSTPSGSMTRRDFIIVSLLTIRLYFLLSRLVSWRYPAKEPQEFSNSSRIALTISSRGDSLPRQARLNFTRLRIRFTVRTDIVIPCCNARNPTISMLLKSCKKYFLIRCSLSRPLSLFNAGV